MKSIWIIALPALLGSLSLDGADQANPPGAGQTKSIAEAIDAGCAFLMERQNSDGSWGSAHQTKGLNIFAPVPGSHRAFRLAVTALSLSALLETKGKDPN